MASMPSSVGLTHKQNIYLVVVAIVLTHLLPPVSTILAGIRRSTGLT